MEVILSFLFFGGCLAFQSYILFTQVLLSQDGDGDGARLSFQLGIAALLVYGCPALWLGGIPIFGLTFFGYTVEDFRLNEASARM